MANGVLAEGSDREDLLRCQAEDMVRSAIAESPQYKAMVNQAMGMMRGIKRDVQAGMKPTAKGMPKKKRGMHPMPDGSMMADSRMAPPPPAK